MNGVIVIDKPPGRTSHDIVLDVRRTLGIKKVGHTGTLDPLATGVLPVCIGEATKLVPFLVAGSKEYRVSMLLGVRTDTLDIEGRVIDQSDPVVTETRVREVLKGFLGWSVQTPPRYSAVKVRGQALYKWTRKGIDVEAPPRQVEIDDLVVEEVAFPYVQFRLSCSGGTYVRSICADAGALLGCGACLAALRRTRSGIFSEAAAIVMDHEDRQKDHERIVGNVIPMAAALPEMPTVELREPWPQKIRDGVQPCAAMLNNRDDIPFLASGDMVKLTCRDGGLAAIAKSLWGSPDLPGLSGDVPIMRLVRVFNEN